MAADLGADRIGLANTQYYGWAWQNRDGLLPSRAQLQHAEATVRATHAAGWKSSTSYPTTTAGIPNPAWAAGADANSPWAQRRRLPCPTAHALPLPRVSVREHPLAWIWERSPFFQASAERAGCPIHAEAAIAARPISADAAARHSS